MSRTYKDLAIAEEEHRLEDAISRTRNLLVEAPTGSGKSLFIPWFLSKHSNGRIVVLQSLPVHVPGSTVSVKLKTAHVWTPLCVQHDH